MNEFNPGQGTNEFGMTLRDYFAAKAMQTLVSDDSSSIRDDVIMAYRIADAMLEIREKELIF